MRACTKCGSQMVTKNKELICIFCPGKKQGEPKSGHKTAVDPGEAYFKSGRVDKKQAVTTIPIIQQGGAVKDALAIMRSLPMPDDIKQFKQVKKIISLLEKLSEDQKNVK